jgi:hypothetical protein
MNGLPVVNINGTKRQVLVDVRIEARDAVRAAMRALDECSPHGRDYQTAAKGQLEIYRQKHRERYAVLDRMANELEDEAIAIQGDA